MTPGQTGHPSGWRSRHGGWWAVCQLPETTVVHMRLALNEMDISKCDPLLQNPSLDAFWQAAWEGPCGAASLLQMLPAACLLSGSF